MIIIVCPMQFIAWDGILIICGACLCVSVCAYGYREPNNLKTVRDRGSVPIGHQQEMTHSGSIGHVINHSYGSLA